MCISDDGFGGLGVACWPLVPKFAGSNRSRRFAACKRSLNLRESRTVPPFAARISRVVADGGTWRLKWERLKGRGGAMANYPQELAQDAVCQSHTSHMTGLWFLPSPAYKAEY